MDNILRATEELNNMLLQSREYQTYTHAKERVMQEPDMYHAMNEYRRRCRQIQMYGAEDRIYDEMCGLVAEFSHILRLKPVEDFLVAEQKFCRMMQEVYLCMNRNLEMDDSYMEG